MMAVRIWRSTLLGHFRRAKRLQNAARLLSEGPVTTEEASRVFSSRNRPPRSQYEQLLLSDVRLLTMAKLLTAPDAPKDVAAVYVDWTGGNRRMNDATVVELMKYGVKQTATATSVEDKRALVKSLGEVYLFAEQDMLVVPADAGVEFVRGCREVDAADASGFGWRAAKALYDRLLVEKVDNKYATRYSHAFLSEMALFAIQHQPREFRKLLQDGKDTGITIDLKRIDAGADGALLMLQSPSLTPSAAIKVLVTFAKQFDEASAAVQDNAAPTSQVLSAAERAKGTAGVSRVIKEAVRALNEFVSLSGTEPVESIRLTPDDLRALAPVAMLQTVHRAAGSEAAREFFEVCAAGLERLMSEVPDGNTKRKAGEPSALASFATEYGKELAEGQVIRDLLCGVDLNPKNVRHHGVLTLRVATVGVQQSLLADRFEKAEGWIRSFQTAENARPSSNSVKFEKLVEQHLRSELAAYLLAKEDWDRLLQVSIRFSKHDGFSFGSCLKCLLEVHQGNPSARDSVTGLFDASASLPAGVWRSVHPSILSAFVKLFTERHPAVVNAKQPTFDAMKILFLADALHQQRSPLSNELLAAFLQYLSPFIGKATPDGVTVTAPLLFSIFVDHANLSYFRPTDACSAMHDILASSNDPEAEQLRKILESY
ncbi:hypothetical protein DIPPA_31071 [Diplonema papillatum]|nr:hypothetical protein DIPPA_31071 [Diplonema papillatum]